jgi:hypothetical protein
VIPSPPEAVYTRGYTYRIAALILGGIALYLLFRFRAPLGQRWFWALVPATVLSLLLFWKLEAGRGVQIHPEGVAVRSGSSSRAMAWDSVREVRYRAIQSRGGVILAFLLRALLKLFPRRPAGVDERAVSIRCVLQDGGKRPLIITSGWSHAGDAVEKILHRVNPRLLKEALDSVRTAGRAEFGPVLVLHDSIARGARSVRFAEVGSWGLESGRFYVKKQGAWLAAIQVPVARIPNVFVLTGLLRQLGVPGARRDDLPSATSGG